MIGAGASACSSAPRSLTYHAGTACCMQLASATHPNTALKLVPCRLFIIEGIPAVLLGFYWW